MELQLKREQPDCFGCHFLKSPLFHGDTILSMAPSVCLCQTVFCFPEQTALVPSPREGKSSGNRWGQQEAAKTSLGGSRVGGRQRVLVQLCAGFSPQTFPMEPSTQLRSVQAREPEPSHCLQRGLSLAWRLVGLHSELLPISSDLVRQQLREFLQCLLL